MQDGSGINCVDVGIVGSGVGAGVGLGREGRGGVRVESGWSPVLEKGCWNVVRSEFDRCSFRVRSRVK